MAKTLFSDTTCNVMLLVEQIRQGDLALPGIQRPFVWPATKVRELLDSMYRGYPVGFLLFWDTGADAGADGLLETSVPGIYAAGDVRSGSIKRCATAVGEGAMVVRFVHEHLSGVPA